MLRNWDSDGCSLSLVSLLRILSTKVCEKSENFSFFDVNSVEGDVNDVTDRTILASGRKLVSYSTIFKIIGKLFKESTICS